LPQITTEETMPTGSILNKFGTRGFTFIAADPENQMDDSVFLHVTKLRDRNQARLFAKGSRVEFEVVFVNRDGREKPQARDVRLVDDVTDVVTPSPTGKRRGHVKFWHPMGYGFIIDEKGDREYYANSENVPRGHLRLGDAVEFDAILADDGGGQAVNVSVFRWDSVGDPYADLLDMGHPKWAGSVATMAEREEWNYRVHPAKDQFTILRNYMKHTFMRLHELPNHLAYSADDNALAFNTGLVTPFQEPIFALFRRRPEGKFGPPWVLRGFEKASSFSFLNLFGGTTPPLARYFDDAAQLVFDTRLPLSVNAEHVPHDSTRFPESLNQLTPRDLAMHVNAKAPEGVERVRRNYKTAIPQFYRDGKSGRGKVQLLLPVSLLRRDHVELALAVELLDSGVYLGRTVLTLDWAYNNARLLTRPDTDWLKP
jgi:cold shock CspA family protein